MFYRRAELIKCVQIRSKPALALSLRSRWSLMTQRKHFKLHPKKKKKISVKIQGSFHISHGSIYSDVTLVNYVTSFVVVITTTDADHNRTLLRRPQLFLLQVVVVVSIKVLYHPNIRLVVHFVRFRPTRRAGLEKGKLLETSHFSCSYDFSDCFHNVTKFSIKKNCISDYCLMLTEF